MTCPQNPFAKSRKCWIKVHLWTEEDTRIAPCRKQLRWLRNDSRRDYLVLTIQDLKNEGATHFPLLVRPIQPYTSNGRSQKGPRNSIFTIRYLPDKVLIPFPYTSATFHLTRALKGGSVATFRAWMSDLIWDPFDSLNWHWIIQWLTLAQLAN